MQGCKWHYFVVWNGARTTRLVADKVEHEVNEIHRVQRDHLVARQAAVNATQLVPDGVALEQTRATVLLDLPRDGNDAASARKHGFEVVLACNAHAGVWSGPT